MDRRQNSWIHGAPEVINQPAEPSNPDDYKYYDPPLSSGEQQRSPAPRYEQFERAYASPEISEPSHTHQSSLLGRSPQISEPTLTKTSAFSPLIQYTEVYSTDPEVAYPEQGKEVLYTEQTRAKTLAYQEYPIPGIHHQNSGDTPQLWSAMDHDDFYEEEERARKPLYKRWEFILAIATVLVLSGIGVALAAIYVNMGRHRSASSPRIGKNNPDVDLNRSVGGYINDAYYSTSGAWNGSGIAIAAANTDYNQAIYAFYQDYTGTIQWTLMDPQGEWRLVGPVNADSPKALNGTPLSTVQHQLGHERVWHLFYIDEDYIIRERIITNTTTMGPTPIWTDGPLNDLNLTVWNSTSVGMQSCYWGSYYGLEGNEVNAGIHLWYASDATTFQQYNWANGSDTWTFDRKWEGLSGNGGVGCQTWDTGMTEYVWFVDTQNSLSMYWKDNNQSVTSTAAHPTMEWTKVDIGVDNVQIDSSLGYTNYMIWQDKDTTIRGANITWKAEDTKIAAGNGANGLDTWTLQEGGNDVYAVRGTHLSITAVKTVSNGASLLAFLQQDGDDMQMFTRDAFNSGALWQTAAQDPVTPSNSK